jgi:hypothetical protein
MKTRWSVLISLFVIAGLWLAPAGAIGVVAVSPQASTTVLTSKAPASPPPAQSPAQPNAPQDVPDTLVSSGVTDYTLAGVKLFWHTAPASCPPAKPDGSGTAPNAPADNFVDIISRVASRGSLARKLYFQQLYCQSLAGRIQSNVVADDNYVYFTKSDGLYQLSVNANVGDAPQLMNALVSGYAEVTSDDTYVYVLTSPGSSSGATVNGVRKDNHQLVAWGSAGAYASNLQVSHGYFFATSYTGDYVYWNQNGNLKRLNLNTAGVATIATGVAAYHADGGRIFFSGIGLFFSDLVYFSTTGTSFGSALKTYNNVSGTTSNALYDAGDDSIRSIAIDADHAFFLQEHFVPCSPQPCFGGTYTDYVMRRGRGASGATDVLYTSGQSFLNSTESNLKEAGDYLFWQSGDAVRRLPKDATALPLTNMRTTALEITQSIQKPDNSVRLIQNKRTFVRMFVQSDGPSVAGVTALLYGRTSQCGAVGPLLPVNDVGTNLTVRSSPQRINLNDSFLFELPWSWTTCGSLTIDVRLNPFHAPPQASYVNNDLSAGPFFFSVSPRLQVQFVAWQYVLFNQWHTPMFIRDIMETYSWIRRAYPVNSTTGSSTDPSAGFRPGLWFAGDDTLGAKVAGTDPSCQDLYWKDDKNVWHDDRNLCASRYTNQQMVQMRAENGLPSSLFFYGMIADTKNPSNQWVFPRGQACCGTAVSSGPVGEDGPNGYFWFNGDGTYADWYAAHEIGHTLGRAHPKTKGPNAANRMCGQSEDDAGYPYNYVQIGADNNTEGFDVGDASLKQPKRIYPGTQWFDVMSYCAQQWLSDYTYEAMYQYMIAHPTAQLTPDRLAAAPLLSGDWVSLLGTIISGTNTATINQAARLNTIDALTALEPGAYAIRLLNGSNATIANYAFTPDLIDGAPGLLSFHEIVTMTAGTAKVQIVRSADNTVLTSLNVPAHSPVISNVALVGAPNPVAGTVTLSWSASHPDGLPLHFDLYYYRDGSPLPQPLQMNVTGNTTQIDTSMLGGGTAHIRVIASDGFNTAHADSASFTMSNKPPVPIIDTPGTGLHIHYGQLINFSGEALDYQDGSVSSANLSWSDQNGALATGAFWSSDNLLVGTHTITLTAMNGAGLSASTSITVVVDDDLDLLGPTLTVGPTQLGWTFATNAAGTQSIALTVGNAGSGSIDWSASSDMPWLTLDVVTGTAPSTIVVTANPSGIPDGTGLSGHVIVSANSLSQTVTIPAGIVVGSLFDKPIAGTPYNVLLPLLRK